VTTAKVEKKQQCTICNFPQRFPRKRYIPALHRESYSNFWGYAWYICFWIWRFGHWKVLMLKGLED